MPNRDTIEKEWAARGFSCDLWTDPPGRCWEDFTHAVDELVMVLEGRVEFEIDGVVRHPGAGEELFIPADALHSVRNRGNTTARWLYGYRRG
jgi:mannose-6-phosphate isomerase-like protein (cupin superfamily)